MQIVRTPMTYPFNVGVMRVQLSDCLDVEESAFESYKMGTTEHAEHAEKFHFKTLRAPGALWLKMVIVSDT